MRSYNYENKWNDLMIPEIVSLLTTIHEFRGQQKLFIEAKPDTLEHLMEIAKVQSTDASNRIEGIYTDSTRLKNIVMNKTLPKSRSEKEIAGYRDVLATIHENHDFLPVKPSFILQLHRDLYKFSGTTSGGKYKKTDNLITETKEDGTRSIRFTPVQAWEVEPSIEAACEAYEKAIANDKIDPLLAIPMFILDFLCTHPFSDGNGRMSRLLTLLMLYQNDYIVGKYVSIEKIINDDKVTYYEKLMQSSAGWHEEENDYAPFVEYTLGLVVAAYRDFSDRVHLISMSGLSKPERVREIIKGTLGKITKAEIMKQCPDISQTTVQRTLNALQKSGEIIKIGERKNASYIWNRENE